MLPGLIHPCPSGPKNPEGLSFCPPKGAGLPPTAPKKFRKGLQSSGILVYCARSKHKPAETHLTVFGKKTFPPKTSRKRRPLCGGFSSPVVDRTPPKSVTKVGALFA